MRILKDYGAAIVLVALALVFMLIQLWTGWMDYVSQQSAHGFSASATDYLWQYTNRVTENIQSEMWQIVVAAWIFKYLLWRDSPESRESDDELVERVRRIEEKLEG